jgi:hypothetical protein
MKIGDSEEKGWHYNGKPQLLLINETIINYLFAVPFLYCISLMVYEFHKRDYVDYTHLFIDNLMRYFNK